MIYQYNLLQRKTYSEENIERILQEFTDRITQFPNETFVRLIRYKDDIVAFIRKDKTGENTYYLGSFNVNAPYMDARLGAEFSQKVIEEDILSEPNATFSGTSLMRGTAEMYVQQGFVGTSIDTDHDYPRLHIEMNASNNQRLTSKNSAIMEQINTLAEDGSYSLSKENIALQFNISNIDLTLPDKENIKKKLLQTTEAIEVFRFSPLSKENEDIIALFCKLILQKGYILTRIETAVHPETKKRSKQCVFEKTEH